MNEIDVRLSSDPRVGCFYNGVLGYLKRVDGIRGSEARLLGDGRVVDFVKRACVDRAGKLIAFGIPEGEMLPEREMSMLAKMLSVEVLNHFRRMDMGYGGRKRGAFGLGVIEDSESVPEAMVGGMMDSPLVVERRADGSCTISMRESVETADSSFAVEGFPEKGIEDAGLRGEAGVPGVDGDASACSGHEAGECGVPVPSLVVSSVSGGSSVGGDGIIDDTQFMSPSPSVATRGRERLDRSSSEYREHCLGDESPLVSEVLMSEALGNMEPPANGRGETFPRYDVEVLRRMLVELGSMESRLLSQLRLARSSGMGNVVEELAFGVGLFGLSVSKLREFADDLEREMDDRAMSSLFSDSFKPCGGAPVGLVNAGSFDLRRMPIVRVEGDSCASYVGVSFPSVKVGEDGEISIS